MKVLKEDIPHSRYRLTTPWSKLIKREFLIKNHIRFPEGLIYEDVLMSVDIWLSSPHIQLVNYSGYNYQVNPSSTTSQKHDTHVVFADLRKKALHTTLKGKFIVLYTLIRLCIHFLLDRK